MFLTFSDIIKELMSPLVDKEMSGHDRENSVPVGTSFLFMPQVHATC